MSQIQKGLRRYHFEASYFVDGIPKQYRLLRYGQRRCGPKPHFKYRLQNGKGVFMLLEPFDLDDNYCRSTVKNFLNIENVKVKIRGKLKWRHFKFVEKFLRLINYDLW